jgi:hypothetical protein
VNSRDDFSPKVKRAVASRAGWLCSLRGCGKHTIGPSEEGDDKVASIGEAAHICAASPGGRRYDALMTPDERSGINNAIWLCSDHAKLIDRDEVTYTAEWLHTSKHEHEAARGRAILTGSGVDLAGLLAIGPDVVCTGELAEISATSWTLRLRHFLIGDVHTLSAFIDSFGLSAFGDRYVLSNELGDGRVLIVAPTLTKQGDGYCLRCSVAPGAPRIDAQTIGTGLALGLETNDWAVDGKGGIAVVSGVDYLPQRLREVLSMQRGESPFWPTFGARLFEYFEAYRGSPWLDLLFKLDVVRLAAIPYTDGVTGETRTPLPCVTRVRNVEILADATTNNRLPIRLDLDVQGIGAWTQQAAVYMPTPEQMA